MYIKTVGSVCSGIEAASLAWKPLGWEFQWFSEIANFPSKVLHQKYPEVNNVGDMENIPELLKNHKICAPDIICAGTPCQAFSLAGWKNGLNDDRGNLTLKFVDIVNENDCVRKNKGKSSSVIFWENVEGVLADKTNAFGCLISSLAGLDKAIENPKWPSAGVLRGPKRNVAWRVLDAKFFGVPQQRKRLYLLAGGKDFYPENILFEKHNGNLGVFPETPLKFKKNGHEFEVFRTYTDCLYSSYGTKWNGNAAAYNGSLFVVQDKRIRRLSPLECERLMGFPDNYTDIEGSTKTNRYQAVGNSWVVPVIEWIGERIKEYSFDIFKVNKKDFNPYVTLIPGGEFYDFGQGLIGTDRNEIINCTSIPENCVYAKMRDIISANAAEDIYISAVGCYGIIRRKQERNLSMNKRLEKILLKISREMSIEEIEKRSRVQKRGKYSKINVEETKS